MTNTIKVTDVGFDAYIYQQMIPNMIERFVCYPKVAKIVKNKCSNNTQITIEFTHARETPAFIVEQVLPIVIKHFDCCAKVTKNEGNNITIEFTQSVETLKALMEASLKAPKIGTWEDRLRKGTIKHSDFLRAWKNITKEGYYIWMGRKWDGPYPTDDC